MKRTLTYASLLTAICLVLSLATLTLSGCSTVAKVLNIENPRYSIRDIRPRIDVAIPLSASSIDFDFTVGVENPNRVGLRLDQIDFSLFVNESRILDSVSQQGLNIPANGTGDVRLRARVGYQSLRNLWGEVTGLIQGNRARYELRGNAHYDTPLGRMTFPVTVSSSR
jgi:LEA14-like dessication related protein